MIWIIHDFSLEQNAKGYHTSFRSRAGHYPDSMKPRAQIEGGLCKPDGLSDLSGRGVFLIPILEPSLCDRVFALDAFEEGGDLRERGFFGEICAVCLVSESTIVLNVLACGLDGRDAKCGRGTFQEVAQGRESGQVFALAEETGEQQGA